MGFGRRLAKTGDFMIKYFFYQTVSGISCCKRSGCASTLAGAHVLEHLDAFFLGGY